MMRNKRRIPGWGRVAITVAAFTASAGFCLAQTQTGLYLAKETSLDIFASYLSPQRGISHVFHTSLDDGSSGGGLGINYFPSRKLGIGTDINMSANGGQFLDSTTMNLIGRLPLGQSGAAPYLLGGGGRSFDPRTQWIGQVGVGLEFRTEHTGGLFIDARYSWAEHTGGDTLLLRAGMRVVF